MIKTTTNGKTIRVVSDELKWFSAVTYIYYIHVHIYAVKLQAYKPIYCSLCCNMLVIVTAGTSS